WDSFRRNLDRLRVLTPISSIAMHGRPFSPLDGRSLWNRYDYRSVGVRCEAYLDLDWRKTLYFTDTAGTWNSPHNLRDRPLDAQALPSPSFARTSGLIAYLSTIRENAVISAHPERWTSSRIGWVQARVTDGLTRWAKRALAPDRATNASP